MAHTFAPFRELAGVPTVPAGATNVAFAERIGSAAAGVALASYGATRRDLPGALLALLGGLLVYRGASGRCECYRQLGIDTTGRSDGHGVPDGQGVHVERSVEVRRSPMELYHFWRDLTHLPRIMPHVKSVTMDGAKSHWVVAGPAGHDVEWDAEFINDQAGELVAWQSLPGSDVQSAGSVHFDAVDGDVTRVRVELKYLPPAGRLGALIADFLGESPGRQLESDLARFKEHMESAR